MFTLAWSNTFLHGLHLYLWAYSLSHPVSSTEVLVKEVFSRCFELTWIDSWCLWFLFRSQREIQCIKSSIGCVWYNGSTCKYIMDQMAGECTTFIECVSACLLWPLGVCGPWTIDIWFRVFLKGTKCSYLILSLKLRCIFKQYVEQHKFCNFLCEIGFPIGVSA